MKTGQGEMFIQVQYKIIKLNLKAQEGKNVIKLMLLDFVAKIIIKIVFLEITGT